MIRVFFLVQSLEPGGAERQLVELVKNLDCSRFAVTVATFYEGGALRSELEGIGGIQVFSLDKKGRWDLVPFIWRLFRLVRTAKPHILHGYLDVPNLLGLLVGRATGARVVWGLRASYIDFSRYDRFSRECFRLGVRLSRFTDLIIVNSQAGKVHHTALGYAGQRMIVIPNGINTERFHPDLQAGHRQRREWGIAPDEHLIGVVGRLDPMKDHPTFLRAAALLLQERQNVRFVCVGGGLAAYTKEMQDLAASLGLNTSLTWAGVCSDMVAVHNALDIATSASYGEGFANVIGEAMACGVPCVVTDVGDSALVVDNADHVVPPGDAAALKDAWSHLLDLSTEARTKLSLAVRRRITEDYSVQQLANKTEAALCGLLRGSC